MKIPMRIIIYILFMSFSNKYADSQILANYRNLFKIPVPFSFLLF